MTDLKHAKALFAGGMKLCKLKPNTKQPVGEGWNDPKNLVTKFDSNASGYGLPLAINGRCSIDPDFLAKARLGVRELLQVELDYLMADGVRTHSTRKGSGGRSMFKDPGGLKWIVLRTKESGTILELRAGSANLQDVVPGLVYHDKDGNECTQSYDDEDRTYLNAPELPEVLFQWWIRMSTDIEYMREQQIKLAKALGETPQISMGGDSDPLPFQKIGYRGREWFNDSHEVEDFLIKHGYEGEDGLFNHPGATGLPGCRKLDHTWFSHNAGDPLHGKFDAWCAFVVLEHEGNEDAALEAIKVELDAAMFEAGADGFVDLDEAEEEEDWLGAPAEPLHVKAGFDTFNAKRVPQDMDAALRYLNKHFFMLWEGSKPAVSYWKEDPMFGRQLITMEKAKFFDALEHVKRPVVVNEKVKMLEVARVWFGHEDKTVYTKTIVDPTKPTGGHKGVLNLWTGFTVLPKPASTPAVADGLARVMWHIREIIAGGNEEHAEWILDWFARMFQYPTTPAGNAIILQSTTQGTGKSLMGGFIREIMGGHSYAASAPEHVVGDKNFHLDGVSFLLAEEAVFAGDRRNIGILKAMITEKTFTVRRLYMDAVQRQQMFHIMMTTNEDWAVHVEGSDRRYAVFTVSDKKAQDSSYFGPLAAAMGDQGVQAAFLHEMMERRVSAHSTPIPNTEARDSQKAHSLTGPKLWLYEFLGVVAGWKEDGVEARREDFPDLDSDIVPAVHDEDNGRVWVGKKAAFAHYKKWWSGADHRTRGSNRLREGKGGLLTFMEKYADECRFRHDGEVLPRGWDFSDLDAIEGKLLGG